MGEMKKNVLPVGFDRSLKLEFHGSRVTNDAGLLAYRQLDDVLGLTVMAEDIFDDWPSGENRQHTLMAWLAMKITNEAERLCADPTMRQVVGGRAKF